MKTTAWTKTLSLLLCLALMAAIALTTTGCNDKIPDDTTPPSASDPVVKGEGDTVFPFTVTDSEGKTTAFEIHTDQTVVGEALSELGLIAGDEGEFGLYVKTVNGLTVDYDKDGHYWAFYVNGEYAPKGVDVTPITAGETYAFKVE